ncbi:speedy protein A isoform X2 [Syngnathoides biaculeatus]|uniref:speedy protein A isoform X2 n=1 Tax=Syngnathoides biaculeatus TaxID=300417 RepID=UPI002ADD3BD6|nr:speedy protein A isoform X2 [Syngnathoides biaculeatus]
MVKLKTFAREPRRLRARPRSNRIAMKYCAHTNVAINSPLKAEGVLLATGRAKAGFHLSNPDSSMMKRTTQWCRTPTPCGVTSRKISFQARRGLSLKRTSNIQDQRGQPGKCCCSNEMYCLRKTLQPIIVVQQAEMESYFKLFDDDQIHDFLLMDSCCRMTDKYLLAMVFVYFKRSRLTIAEYTKKNFFIALYLANTMEEEAEEIRYEIFSWALGETWRTQFPQFIKQRDKFWVRIEFRAAVSRHCCEEVMAIMPSHFVWKRERSEKHSGAQRHYEERETSCLPRRSSEQSCNPTLPLTSQLSLEETLPRVRAARTGIVETSDQTQHSSQCSESKSLPTPLLTTLPWTGSTDKLSSHLHRSHRRSISHLVGTIKASSKCITNGSVNIQD